MKKFKFLFGFICSVVLSIVGVIGLQQEALAVTYTGNVIPKMTSNSAPSGGANTSSFYPSSIYNTSAYQAWKGFDGTTNSSEESWVSRYLPSATSPQWLSYQFDTPKVISKYTLISGLNKLNSAPVTWTFEGSNDGASWDILDTRQNIKDWSLWTKKEFTFANSTAYKIYRINITANNGHGTYVSIQEMEMMEEVNTNPITSISLNKSTTNLFVGNTETLIATVLPTDATNKTVTWTSSNPLVAEVDSTGKITAKAVGTAIITATTVDGGYTATCIVNVTNSTPTLDVTSTITQVYTNTEFTTFVSLHNVKDIYAEDIKLNYDSTLFEFVKAECVQEGIGIYHQDTTVPGKLRFIVVSKGESYGINGDAQLLKLTFKSKNLAGKGKIEPTFGLVANGIDGTETEVTCSGTEIEVILGDVNKTGKFTLADLAIDGRHFGMTKANWDINYNVDIAVNDAVDETDLTTIVSKILIDEASI